MSILLSIAVIPILALEAKLVPDDSGTLGSFILLGTLAIVAGLVAREKGRWIAGWAVCSIIWPLFVVLLLIPYEEYRRMQLNGTATTDDGECGIEVKPTFPALAVLLFAVQPRIVIDEADEYVLEWWAKRRFPLPPGTHALKLYFPFVLGKHGKKHVTVSVGANELRRIHYFVRPLLFVPGIARVY